jgi:gamma-glutamyltranspeptidase/glutathione hydrolase
MRRTVLLAFILAFSLPLPTQAAEQRSMVAAAHPLAVDAGLAALKAGGNAMDAAVAVQMVLALVEPAASGLGGGAFLLHYDAASGAVTSWDGRETAPAAVQPALFLDPNGNPLGFRDAALGGRAVGVPGVIRMLEAAHQAHGKLPWETLVTPAAHRFHKAQRSKTRCSPIPCVVSPARARVRCTEAQLQPTLPRLSAPTRIRV